MENEAVDLEQISYWLKKYEGHIGVGQCSCRVSRKVIGEGCADDDWAGVSVLVISLIIAVRLARVTISHMKKHLRLLKRGENMVSFIRLLISMVRIRYSVSVTVMLISVMLFVHHSYSTHLICLVLLIRLTLRKRSV